MQRAVVLVCLLATTVARANSDDIVSRPIVQARGAITIDVNIESNLAHKFWAQPLSLAPDLWWGVTDRLTLGLVHSNTSLERFAPGASFCVRTDDVLYCDRAYHGSGLDARYQVLEGPVALAPRVRVLARDLEPLKPAITLGALARWHRGRYAITLDPYLQLGLANQDQGNRAQLWLPVRLSIQPTCRWELALSTGWNGELATLRDGWHVPVALGARVAVTPHVDLSTTFGFATLLGPQNTPKQRVLFVGASWRLP